MALTIKDTQGLADAWEQLPAEELLFRALDGFYPKIALACSFQAEESVLIDMMHRLRGSHFRVFTLDTGRLNPETYDCMDAIRQKYGVEIEVFFPQAEDVEAMVRSHGLNLFYGSVELRKLCCGVRKIAPLGRALKDLDAWITGLRREQAATRAEVSKVEVDKDHGGIIKINPLVDWTHEQVWKYIRENNLPYNKLHDHGYPSIGCAPCTRRVEPGEDIRAGRWWWENAEHKECGLHVAAGSREHGGGSRSIEEGIANSSGQHGGGRRKQAAGSKKQDAQSRGDRPVARYPIFLDMRGRACIVIGGGVVAERKVRGLLEVEAAVTVVSPTITERLQSVVSTGAVRHVARSYAPGDLRGFDVAFVATDNENVNESVFEEARSQRVWINSADDPEHCDFIMPAVLRRGDLTVAVSTGGKSPAAARSIKEELETYFNDTHGSLIEVAAQVRAEVREKSVIASAEAWNSALNGEFRHLVQGQELGEAKELLLSQLGAKP